MRLHGEMFAYFYPYIVLKIAGKLTNISSISMFNTSNYMYLWTRKSFQRTHVCISLFFYDYEGFQWNSKTYSIYNNYLWNTAVCYYLLYLEIKIHHVWDRSFKHEQLLRGGPSVYIYGLMLCYCTTETAGLQNLCVQPFYFFKYVHSKNVFFFRRGSDSGNLA